MANEIRVNKAFSEAAYLQSVTPIDKVGVEKAHVLAVYMSAPMFSIVGNELQVSNQKPGTWPVNVRATDANLATFDKQFNVTITD